MTGTWRQSGAMSTGNGAQAAEKPVAAGFNTR